MRHREFAFLLTGLLLASCGGEPREEAEEAEADTAVAVSDEEMLTELTEYWETHYNMHHASMVADRYADSSVVLVADGSVAMGRDQIEAWLSEGMEAMSPTAELSPMHQMVLGDHAVTMGTYSMSGTPEGAEPITYGGTYMALADKDSAGWEIEAMMTNYDSPRPEGWQWADPEEEPAEEGTMDALVEEYTTHWNLGHPTMVADYYTDDAVVSFANGPMLHGKEAVSAALEAVFETPTQITIHDVQTTELGEGYRLDGGWYELADSDGAPVEGGMYLGLARQQDDGSWKIHWFITNAIPAQGM